MSTGQTSLDTTATPAFILGVTGHMDLRADEKQRLSKQLRLLFRFLKLGPAATDPDPEPDADHPPTLLESLARRLPVPAADARGRQPANPYQQALQNWTPLSSTPVVVLSSLAPGADTLVAEVALEPEFREMGFRVMAPLPFPVDLYREATTFTRTINGQPDPDNAARREQYDRLLERIGSDSAFPVRLDEDFDCPNADLQQHLQDDLLDRDRRRLRYRAGGEYIAAYAHLLIAIWDDEAERDTTCGTAQIVEIRRRRLTPDLLRTTGSLALADSGPLLHLYTHRVKNKATPPVESSRKMRFLHPYGSAPERGAADDDRAWQRNRLALLRRVGGNLESFNTTASPSAEDVEEQLDQRLAYKAQRQMCSFAPTLKVKAPRFHETLRCLVALHRRAGLASRRLKKDADKTLKLLFLLTLLAATLLHLFAHWHPQIEHGAAGHEPASVAGSSESAKHAGDSPHAAAPAVHNFLWWIRPLLGTGALFSGLGGLIVFWRRHPERRGERAHDYRALAEGMRVQYFWNVAGLGRSVPANYMNRQRNELDWIRGAIRSVAFPYSRWREWFNHLDRGDQLTALRCVLHGWVLGQASYFDKRTHEHHHWLHFWHKLGGVLAVAGLGTALVLCLSVWSGRQLEWFQRHWLQAALSAGAIALLTFVGGSLLRCFTGARSAHVHQYRFQWVLDQLVPTRDYHRSGSSSSGQGTRELLINFLAHLPLSLALALLALALCGLFSKVQQFPGAVDLAIVSAGFLLLAGALAVAWAEKNLFSELAYQYNTMAALFRNAQSRLEADLQRLEAQLGDAAQFDKVRCEIQEFLFDLGREALDENAEWLILHRARPLEPVMAG